MGGDIVKIYVASSWRNPRQPAVVEALRAAGHEVYDFRNPMPGNTGFGWRQCDPRPPSEWSVDDYRRVLETPRAQEGFALDMDALRSSDACVLVLPCGRSAHLELGWAVGAGKRTLVLCEKLDEPELMYLMSQGGANSICASLDELVAAVAAPRPTDDDDGLADDRSVADLAQALRRTEGAALNERRDDADPLGEREHVRHAGLQSATAPLAVAIRHPADTEGSLSRGSDSDRRGKDLP